VLAAGIFALILTHHASHGGHSRPLALTQSWYEPATDGLGNPTTTCGGSVDAGWREIPADQKSASDLEVRYNIPTWVQWIGHTLEYDTWVPMQDWVYGFILHSNDDRQSEIIQVVHPQGAGRISIRIRLAATKGAWLEECFPSNDYP
jgi:hypothetical protein